MKKSIFLLFLTTAIGGVASAATMSLTPAVNEVDLDQSFVVDLVADSGGADIVVADAIIDYDPALLHLESISTESSPLNYDFPLNSVQLPRKSINNVNGKGRIIYATPAPGVSGSNLLLAQLQFKSVGAGTSDISVQFTESGASGDSNLIVNDNLGTDVLSKVTNTTIGINGSDNPDGNGNTSAGNDTAGGCTVSSTGSFDAVVPLLVLLSLVRILRARNLQNKARTASSRR